MHIFPGDTIDVEPLLVELAEQDLIVRYEVDGAEYIEIPTFTEHQRPHHQEKDRAIPPRSEAVRTLVRSPSNLGASQSALNPECGILNDSPTENMAPTEPSASADPEPPKVNGYDRELEASILAAYHEILPNLPKVRDWNERRKRKLRDRIRERVKAGKPADKAEYWLQVFRKAAESDFLMGRKTDWRCPGLEWLLEPKNFTKLIEGAYDNHGRS